MLLSLVAGEREVQLYVFVTNRLISNGLILDYAVNK